MNMNKKILITVLIEDDISIKTIINNHLLIKDYHELKKLKNSFKKYTKLQKNSRIQYEK